MKTSGTKKHADRRRSEPEFFCWKAMLRRCSNPNHDTYKYYGGRGITVCERWRKSFWDFRADVGPRPTMLHTLERKDNNGNYEPDNVVWATKAEQSKNRRQRVRPVTDVIASAAMDWATLPAIVDATQKVSATRQAVTALLYRLVRLGQMERRGERGSQQYRMKGTA